MTRPYQSMSMLDTTELAILQWALLGFFLIPLIEAIMALFGAAWAHWGYVQNPDKFKKLIIQITSVGEEPNLVQRTVNTLRDYNLPMPYEVWVAVEPGQYASYDNVDRIIVVPSEFTCRPIGKARALEYTRLLRKELGYNRESIKLLLVDDDTLPTERYVHKAFYGDYDVCQGITVPNRWYATGGWKHFVLSHLDNIRTRNCLIYCSCTQGVTQKPLFVHGEGLCMTGAAEEQVTWNRPIVASDDLVFGTNAAYLGLSWGYFHAAIQLVSPWSFRENLKQRRRWTWGNFDAIASREIMPRASAYFKAFKYSVGFTSVIASTTGAVLLLTGIAKVPPQAHVVFWISLACWFLSYGVAGWINSGGEPNRELRPSPVRYWGFRVLQTLAATVLTPVTAIAPILVISYSILKGRPKKFIMIKKFNEVMNRTP